MQWLYPVHFILLTGLLMAPACASAAEATTEESAVRIEIIPLATDRKPTKPFHHLMDHTFSEAYFEPKCEKEVVVVPVYFYALDHVELLCGMCVKGTEVNGEVKKWKFVPARNPNKFNQFLANPQKEADGPLPVDLYKFSENKRQYVQKKIIEGDGHLPVAGGFKYFQNHGRLIIRGAAGEASGVYFCSNSNTKSQTRLFYVLMGMAPIVMHSAASLGKDSLWNVGHRRKTPVDDDSCDYHSGQRFMMDEYAHMRYHPVAVTGKGLKRAYNLTLPAITGAGAPDLNLQVALEFDFWSQCTNGRKYRTREGHCVLRKKDKNKDIPNLSGESLIEWAMNLQNYFKRVPTIRLHNYLLDTLIMNRKSGEECGKKAVRLKNFYELILMPAMKQNGFKPPVSKQLSMCMELMHEANGDYSLRGTSFIQIEECPKQ